MSTPRPSDDQARRQRAGAIQQLIADVRVSLEAGRSVNEHSLMAAHPELMPELGEAFKAMWKQQDAAQLDAPAVAETIVRPGRVQDTATVGETVTRATSGASGGARDTTLAPPTASSEEEPSRAMRDALERMQGGAAGRSMQIPGYSVQRELSRGGQAVVFLAIQLSTGRRVALKVMREGPFADERSLARFQREVQILAALDHPNIVSIIDTGRAADGSHFIAMPYIAGGTLDDFMKGWQQKEQADPSRMLRMFYKICMAVNEAHIRGIVHRDLKPSNIRVDERGEPHILDFGLARTALDRFIRGSSEPVSVTGEFMGSLPWSSPEQAEGDPEKIDMRTDVYSLGVILYQMLTGGRFPYEVVGNIRDVLNNILTRDPEPPSQVLANLAAAQAKGAREIPEHRLPAINETIERIVLKSLSKKKEVRYQSAGELGKDVARYLLGKKPKDESHVKTPIQKADSPAEASGSKAPVVVLVSACLLVCLAVGIAIWMLAGHSKATPNETAATSNSTGDDANGVAADQAVPAVPLPVDLMGTLDPTSDSINGVWKLQGHSLVCQSSTNAQFELPYVPPAEYDYQVGFTRSSGTGAIGMLINAGGHQVTWNVSHGGNTTYGLCMVDGKRMLDHANNLIVNQQHYVCVLKVRKDHIEAYLNDKLLTQFGGDFSRLSLEANCTPRRSGTIGLVMNENAMTIDSLAVTEISGSGTLLRIASVTPPASPAVNTTPQPSTPALPAPPGPNWTRIFDGQDFTGWESGGRGGRGRGAAAPWQIVDGAMVGHNAAPGPRGGVGQAVIGPSKLYHNFRMRAAVMLDAGSTGGIRFLQQDNPNAGGGAQRFNIILAGTGPTTGNIMADNLLRSNARPTNIAPGKWFTIEVGYENSTVSVAINGQPVSQYTDAGIGGMQGRVQFSTGSDSTIRIKDVFMRDLGGVTPGRGRGPVP